MLLAPNGFIAHSNGLVETRPPNAQNNLLAREQAWRDAVVQQKEKRAEFDSCASQIEVVQKGLDEKRASLAELDEQIRQRIESERGAAETVAKQQRQSDRAQQHFNFLQRQQKNLAQEKVRLTHRLTELSQQIEDSSAQINKFDQEIELAQVTLERLPIAELSQQKEGWQQKINSAQTILAGRQAVVDSRQATLEQATEQLNQASKRITRLESELGALSLTELNQQLTTHTARLNELNQSLTPLRQQLRDNEEKIERSEREIAGIQRVAHEHETYLTKAKIQVSQQESSVDGLKERIRNDLGLVAFDYDEEETTQEPLPIAELVEKLPEINELPAGIENDIQKFRGQLRRMGAINPDAPIEYQETQKRHTFLTAQLTDLEETEGQLRQVISELDNLTSRAFIETVQKVNSIFGEMFTNLFGGGTAELTLTDPDNLTISGVDILAQLPNRRQQGLGLLSGGERSLTAAALIFALLKVSPTPFCVMDEVDAMLDEANIDRFVDAVRELSLNTQFIVITHNRGTVQAAQTVYGISMGTDSTSIVTSIKPEDYLSQKMP